MTAMRDTASANGRAWAFASHVAKRGLDVSGAVFGLIFLFPVLAIAAAAILSTLGPPVLFSQRRAGRHGKTFVIYKLRTMTNGRDSEGTLLPDSQRLTRLGRFLRRMSLDELPSLFNVLFGDMSLVGPRPLLMSYLTRYSPHQARRHDVKPGLTGWAQINGRNALAWEEKLDLDVWYVDHRTIWLDLRILLMTPGALVRGNGVAARGHATMPEFKGTRS